ncbi:hypothetical protein, partial [Vibrio ordalii]|uniref:hypothetical protein n=1 Tax=Vibrio ordalii TaxID=28174 RepID=UPI000570BC8D
SIFNDHGYMKLTQSLSIGNFRLNGGGEVGRICGTDDLFIKATTISTLNENPSLVRWAAR